jgi:hypothetical protein
MTKAIRSDTALSMTVAGFLLFTPLAAAQQSVIDHCRNTSSDADRIACLEAALLGRASETTRTDTTQSQIDPPSMEIEAGPADSSEAPSQSTVDGIGASQVIARNQTSQERLDSLEQARDLRVASYGMVPFQRLLVTLENGQVWRQIKGDTQQVRVDLKRNQTVDIEESSLGGFKLRLNEMRRTIRVERVK